MTDAKDQLELAKTVLKQGELRLQAQLQVALAADQRAMTLGGILIAGAAACFGLAGDAEGAALYGIFVATAALTAAAAVTLMAAWPRRFFFPGAMPDTWWRDGVVNRPLVECLERESWNYDRYIAHNERTLAGNAAWLRRGAILGVLSPGLGALAWAAAVAWVV